MMHNHSHYPMADEEDLAPLMGARQRRLGGDAPYRDDPVSKQADVHCHARHVGLTLNALCIHIIVR